MFIKNTGKYYAVVGGKKGGVIRVWDTRKRQLVFQSSGYTVEMKGKWLSNQSQGVSSYSCVDNTVTVSAPFVAVNQKTFSPLLFMAFRLFTITFGRNAGIARLVKNTLVKVLVKRKKVVPLKLSRKIVFHEDHIDITDELSDKSVRVSHGDKFSTFHMGSSRYVDVVEEQLRGKGYPTAQLTFDSQGVLKSGKITFS